MIKIPKSFFHWTISFLIIQCTSCKKEFSCEGCINGNHPPLANAGPDQAITLPTDSISLDGSASSDPDGKISAWRWSKISGPASFAITNEDLSKTTVTGLDSGTYEFELRVTNDKGLSDRDTMEVKVIMNILGNSAPTAIALKDTTIVLPVNSMTLDGTQSTDPDNNISSYHWTKIAGPSLYIIEDANRSKTEVHSLAEGIYLFELKVTDLYGLFSLDTIQVIVKAEIIEPPAECDNSNRPVISVNLIPIGKLSKARMQINVASVGSKILFAGGRWTNDCPDCWGSSRVDIYDTETGQWSTAQLSDGRWGMASVTVGNKVFFAGGEWGDGAFDDLSNAVDIYDAETNTWTSSNLSEKRSYIAAAAVGDKVFFAGGWQEDTRFSPPTAKIDVYHISSHSWTTATLSEPRGWASGLSGGQKVYFAGGLNAGQSSSDRIDIYDNQTGNWTTSNLSTPMGSPAGIATGGNMYWASGCDVEIMEASSSASSMANLFRPGAWDIDDGANAVIKDNKLFFFRQISEDIRRFDIYDIAMQTWFIGELPQNFNYSYYSVISVNNTIYLAGGRTGPYGSETDQVWKLEF